SPELFVFHSSPNGTKQRHFSVPKPGNTSSFVQMSVKVSKRRPQLPRCEIDYRSSIRIEIHARPPNGSDTTIPDSHIDNHQIIASILGNSRHQRIENTSRNC